MGTAVRGGSVVGYRTVGYNGAGDAVTGAIGWWGLRAYTLASIGSNAIRLRASGDNAESDFATVAGGGLDLAGISTFLGAHGGSLFVAKLYDQTGNANDLVQGTAAAQPAFTLSGLGSLPIMTHGANSNLHASSPTTQAGPWTFSSVVQRPANAGVSNFIHASPGVNLLIEFGTSNNIIQANIQSGPSVTASATDVSYHAVQGIATNATLFELYIDGVSSTGNPTNSPDFSAATIDIGPASFEGQGIISQTEIGFWGSGFSAGQKAAMNANQHAYWGF